MPKNRKIVLSVARIGIISSLYAVLTILLAPISYGPIQCRVSEIMTLFPLFFIEAIPGLAIGCLIANIYSGWWADMVFGTLATLIASVCTYLVKRFVKNNAAPFIGGIFPVLVNALILPMMWLLFAADAAYWFNALAVFIGQTIAVYALGIPVFFGLKKAKIEDWGIASNDKQKTLTNEDPAEPLEEDPINDEDLK